MFMQTPFKHINKWSKNLKNMSVGAPIGSKRYPRRQQEIKKVPTVRTTYPRVDLSLKTPRGDITGHHPAAQNHSLS